MRDLWTVGSAATAGGVLISVPLFRLAAPASAAAALPLLDAARSPPSCGGHGGTCRCAPEWSIGLLTTETGIRARYALTLVDGTKMNITCTSRRVSKRLHPSRLLQETRRRRPDLHPKRSRSRRRGS